MFNSRNEVLNSEFRNSVKGHYSALTVEPPTDQYPTFCTKRDTKLVNETKQSIVVILEPLLVGPCTACRFTSSLIPRRFRNERKLAITCLHTLKTLQYKHQKRATNLIVTIQTDINACNHNESNNKKREGGITSRLGG